MADIIYENGEPIVAIVMGEAVEVQRVKRGRWIKYPMDEWGAANCECSVCHTRQFFPLLLVKGGDNYCGNCGAKMDEVEE